MKLGHIRWSHISVSSVSSRSPATTNWSSTSGQLKNSFFFIQFLSPGFTRERSRTSVRTVSAGSSSCPMSSNTQGFTQVANHINQFTSFACSIRTLSYVIYQFAFKACYFNLKRASNGHRKTQINRMNSLVTGHNNEAKSREGQKKAGGGWAVAWLPHTGAY